jgi:1-acyl-sn-glycerol-3-phosphate acyltransferase
VIANHPSLIDVVVLIAFIRDANCVVKQSLWDNPCMRGPIRAAGYISNSGSMDMLEEAAGALEQGQTLIVFPEGTRTTPGQAPEFHRGAAAIAVRGASVVTPVVISVTPTTLTPDQGRALVQHSVAPFPFSPAGRGGYRPAALHRAGSAADCLAQAQRPSAPTLHKGARNR